MHEIGARHIAKVDERMAKVIHRVGPCQLPKRRGGYAALARIIVAQQISTKAAASVWAKLRTRAGGHVTAERIAALDEDTLRGAGLSGQKTGYIQHLTELVTNGDLNLRRLPRLDDEAVIEELTEVKGLGRWSAEMFLMFVLNRPDVLPVGDLGIQNGFQRVFNMRARPSARRMERLAACWRPYRTIGSWYIWRSLDAVPT